MKMHLRIVRIAGNPVECRDPDKHSEYALKVKDLMNVYEDDCSSQEVVHLTQAHPG
jgi:hypothetical protein